LYLNHLFRYVVNQAYVINYNNESIFCPQFPLVLAPKWTLTGKIACWSWFNHFNLAYWGGMLYFLLDPLIISPHLFTKLIQCQHYLCIIGLCEVISGL